MGEFLHHVREVALVLEERVAERPLTAFLTVIAVMDYFRLTELLEELLTKARGWLSRRIERRVVLAQWSSRDPMYKITSVIVFYTDLPPKDVFRRGDATLGPLPDETVERMTKVMSTLHVRADQLMRWLLRQALVWIGVLVCSGSLALGALAYATARWYLLAGLVLWLPAGGAIGLVTFPYVLAARLWIDVWCLAILALAPVVVLHGVLWLLSRPRRGIIATVSLVLIVLDFVRG